MLNIEIHSFSYKKGGIPKDTTGNGGGFVFDCRGIKNPGRIDEYKPLTGSDWPVQEYLERQTQMPNFLENVFRLVSISLQTYTERGFEHLQISFGCTGGQHRSVYSAIRMADFIKGNYPEMKVTLIHDEQTQLNSIA